LFVTAIKTRPRPSPLAGPAYLYVACLAVPSYFAMLQRALHKLYDSHSAQPSY